MVDLFVIQADAICDHNRFAIARETGPVDAVVSMAMLLAKAIMVRVIDIQLPC